MVLQVASQEVEFWALLRCCVLGYEHFDEAEFSDRSWGREVVREAAESVSSAHCTGSATANDARGTPNTSQTDKAALT